jgi:hypothetical protein
MDEQTELGNIIARWLAENGLDWRVDWGTHNNSKPLIVRRHSWGNSIAHLISDHRVLIDYRYPQAGIKEIWLDVADPKFFTDLKAILADCEQIFNY